MVAAAVAKPTTVDEVRRLLTRRSRVQNPPLTDWFAAIRAAIALPVDELPDLRTPSTTLPPPKLWKDRNPMGYARLTHARAVTIARAAELDIPVENLISPDALRKLVWHNPPAGSDQDLAIYASQTLIAASAREWQAAQISELLVDALRQTQPLITPEQSESPETADVAE